MADRQSPPRSTFLSRLHDRAPTSAQAVGLLTLLVSGGVLLLLSGVTVTGITIALILFAPLLLITSPVWVPAAVVLFLCAAATVAACGFGVAAAAAATWMYRYFTGRHPLGSGRVDYARNRIADTASHVKDYAREYGGYLQRKTKDAAPGA